MLQRLSLEDEMRICSAVEALRIELASLDQRRGVLAEFRDELRLRRASAERLGGAWPADIVARRVSKADLAKFAEYDRRRNLS